MDVAASESFQRSVERFRRSLTNDQERTFSSSSLEDVELSIHKIQEKIGPEKKLRNFSRIRKFLEGMKQLEELVKVFLNVHEVVAFVWVSRVR